MNYNFYVKQHKKSAEGMPPVIHYSNHRKKRYTVNIKEKQRINLKNAKGYKKSNMIQQRKINRNRLKDFDISEIHENLPYVMNQPHRLIL